jgi:hypothetical protein
MPRVFEPSNPKAGPLRRLRKNEKERSRSLPPIASFGKASEESIENKQKHSFIGQDLLEWHGENTVAAAPKKKAAKATAASNRTAQKSKLKNSKEKVHVPHRSTADADRDLVLAQQRYSSLSRHALALDTRYLQLEKLSDESEQAGHATAYYKDFIRTLAIRGATPGLVATTTAKGVKTYSLGDDATLQKVTDSDLLVSRVSIRAKETTCGALSIPKEMTAESSWMLFAEMGTCNLALLNRTILRTVCVSLTLSIILIDWFTVDSILAKDAKLDPSTKRTALDITLLCTDVSLFCDTNTKAHKAAVERFASHVAPFFRKSLLNSIQIITAITGKIALRLDDQGQCNSAPKDADEDTTMKGSEAVPLSKVAVQNQEDALSKCVDVIEATFDELEYTVPSRHGVATGSESGNPINIAYSVMDSSSVGYKCLSRQWIRDSLLVRRLACRLHFDLPATFDGTQCSVAFEATYQIFPFAINSPQAKMLSSDLVHLSKSDIQVTQLVPLSSIDASILFGIPMTVRAGLENDYVQFQEMEVLVRSLFRLLQERELAILLRGTTKRANENVYNPISSGGLFQSNSSSSEQIFVLMAQELPLSVGHSPPTGLLYRIAHADQLLAEAAKSNLKSDSNKLTSDEEMEAQYTEYIEEALSGMELRPFNPLDETSRQPTSPPRQRIYNVSAAVEPVGTTSATFKESSMSISREENSPDESELQSASAASVFDDTAGIGSTIVRGTDNTALDEDAMCADHTPDFSKQSHSSIWK